MNLPPPSIDMCDGAASMWLDQLADLYTGTDASHVRGLATRLQRRHDEGIQAEKDERNAAAKRKADELAELESRLDEIVEERKELDDREDEIGSDREQLDDEEMSVDRKLTALRSP